jgi:hypothetical protein
MPPAEFVHVKDLLVRDNLRVGHVRLERAKVICTSIDQAKLAKVYEEVVKAGWIRPNP